jgi:tetratricopeptide (TPR) repeat protein
VLVNKWARPRDWNHASAKPAIRASAATHHYFAFLSYSHADAADADWLHEELERFRVPRALEGRLTQNGAIPRRLTPVFRDRHELAAADDLGAEIHNALAGSQFLIVLCSPAAARSRWTNAEIEAFKRTRPEGCVLAAIVGGEPFASETPGREAEECFPPALRHRYDRRGRPTAKRAEPLAADLRETGDGKRMGFLKLVAGMLGIGLDDLVQRETLRRQRRLAWLAAASLGGMAVTSSLAIWAVQARDEARDQRREAEGLVGFMLGDLREKLEPIGRLDALDAVGARALAYFEKQDKSELSDDALAQRSRALTLIGEIANARGDLDGALRRYREAMATTGELARRYPDDPQRLFDHAQNVFWVGEIARQRRQMSEAEQAIREYKSLAERMVALEPGNSKWRMEVKYADTNLAVVLMERRKFAEASRLFEQSLQIIESLLAAEPANRDYNRSLTETLAWLGDSQFAEGRFDDSLAQREREMRILASLIGHGTSDVEYRRQMVVAQNAAADVFAARGETSAALSLLDKGLATVEELMRSEPGNVDWATVAADLYFSRAGLQLAVGDATSAGISARAGCDIVNRLRLRDSTVFRWRVELRNTCLGLRARLALTQNSSAEAAALADQAAQVARAETQRSSSIDALQQLANAEVLRGIVAARMGDPAKAKSAFAAAQSAWPKNVGEEPPTLARKTILMLGIGNSKETERLSRRLDELGYRHPLDEWDRKSIRNR